MALVGLHHALGAMIVTAALIAVPGCSGDPGGATEPGGGTVEIDIFSGRQNPTLPLCDGAADELRAELDAGMESATNAADPETGLGFRGFIVTLDEPDGARTVRVVGEAAYLEHDGKTLLIADDGVIFGIVWDCVKTDIDPALVDEIQKAMG